MLACLAMMCGCSDEESEQNDTPVEVSDWTQLVLACQNGGTVEAPTRVALAADIKLGSRHQTVDKYAEADKRDWLLSDRRQWAYPFFCFGR